MPTDNEIFESDENGLATLDRGDQREAMTETLIWLNYVSQLDPDDESGAFLIPADLKAVDEAYARLQLSDPGTPNFPGNQTRVASSADDDFIKQKMAFAIDRAQKVEMGMPLVERFRMLALINPSGISVKVIRYERGVISGKCMVLLPQGGTREKIFSKENGWKAEVEIKRGKEISTRTVYARGICMNVIASEAWQQEAQLLEYDYSCIDFQPLALGNG